MGIVLEPGVVCKIFVELWRSAGLKTGFDVELNSDVELNFDVELWGTL